MEFEIMREMEELTPDELQTNIEFIETALKYRDIVVIDEYYDGGWGSVWSVTRIPLIKGANDWGQIAIPSPEYLNIWEELEYNQYTQHYHVDDDRSWMQASGAIILPEGYLYLEYRLQQLKGERVVVSPEGKKLMEARYMSLKHSKTIDMEHSLPALKEAIQEFMVAENLGLVSNMMDRLRDIIEHATDVQTLLNL
jgi:hypothetical protein